MRCVARNPPINLVLNDVSPHRIALARSIDDFLSPAIPAFNRRQRHAEKRIGILAASEQLGTDVVIGELAEVTGTVPAADLAFKNFCVGFANPKRNQVADIPEYSLADFVPQLVDVLVTQRKTKPILALSERIDAKESDVKLWNSSM